MREATLKILSLSFLESVTYERQSLLNKVFAIWLFIITTCVCIAGYHLYTESIVVAERRAIADKDRQVYQQTLKMSRENQVLWRKYYEEKTGNKILEPPKVETEIKKSSPIVKPAMLPIFMPIQIMRAQLEQVELSGFYKWGYPAVIFALVVLIGTMVKYQHEERKEELEQRSKMADASLQNAVETKAQTTLINAELQTIKTMLTDVRNK